MPTNDTRNSARLRVAALCLTLGLLGTAVVAQVPATAPAPAAAMSPDVEATHTALRALRDSLLDAWTRRDMDALLTHVDPDVVVTWQNGELSRGPEGIRKFYNEVMVGPNRLISDISSTLKVDELSILHGDNAAIAFGSIHDDFTLSRGIARTAVLGSGDKFSLDSRWTATMVKKDGQWKLASYHVSVDAFSNPILSKAVAVAKQAAIIAGIVGLSLGAIVTWFYMRRRAS
jgi:ketosteroid isomerase-like protein